MGIGIRMNAIYNAPNSRNKRKGKDKGNYAIYHISIPEKHRGVHQGYIGVSTLTVEQLFKRYLEEIEEAKRKGKWRGYVLKNLDRFKDEWKIELIMTGLTKEEAYFWEGQLRPEDNLPSNRDFFNWNYKAGGQT